MFYKGFGRCLSKAIFQDKEQIKGSREQTS